MLSTLTTDGLRMEVLRLFFTGGSLSHVLAVLSAGDSSADAGMGGWGVAATTKVEPLSAAERVGDSVVGVACTDSRADAVGSCLVTTLASVEALSQPSWGFW